MREAAFVKQNKEKWIAFEKAINFGSKTDPDQLADGYIHFSTANQLAETLEKHFSGRHNLVLVAVSSDGLENLKWEPSRGGDLFPHLYGELDVNFAESAVDLPVGKDGKHVLPEELG